MLKCDTRLYNQSELAGLPLEEKIYGISKKFMQEGFTINVNFP